jgi:5-(carboxyamino)imidazole ribonucleotide synthase
MSDEPIQLPFEKNKNRENERRKPPSPPPIVGASLPSFIEPVLLRVEKIPPRDFRAPSENASFASSDFLMSSSIPPQDTPQVLPPQEKTPDYRDDVAAKTMTGSDSLAVPNPTSKVYRLGILGGGQLGRMTAQAAQKLGFRVHVFTPEENSPASAVANETTVAHWTDAAALNAFAQSVDVVTLEFENIPVEATTMLSHWVPVYPQPHVLEITQNRWLEKSFLASQGFPLAPFAMVSQAEQLEAASREVEFPIVLKTVHSGYDGKGQARANNIVALRCAFAAAGSAPCVLERFLPLEREISVIGARDASGRIETFPPFENQHDNHILDITLTPARISDRLAQEATELTVRIMNALGIQGLLCVEFFVEKSGQLLINEIAPRPHNSGHLTLEAAPCSQFEQLVRAVTGLELASCQFLKPAAMANLMGELWQKGEPDWGVISREPGVTLHLYGKTEPRSGRKMGHLTATGSTAYEAEQRVSAARNLLKKR